MPGSRSAYVLSKVNVGSALSGGEIDTGDWDFKSVKKNLRRIDLPEETNTGFIREDILPFLDSFAPKIRRITIAEKDFSKFVSKRIGKVNNKCQFYHWQVDLASDYGSRTICTTRQNLAFLNNLSHLKDYRLSVVVFTDTDSGVRTGVNREPTAMIYRWIGEEGDYNDIRTDFEDFLYDLMKSGKI